MCLEQCLAVGASQKLLYNRLFFMISFTHCSGLVIPAGLAPMEALLTSTNFWEALPCLLLCSSIFLPPGQPVAHSARGTAEPRAHLTTNHQSLHCYAVTGAVFSAGLKAK